MQTLPPWGLALAEQFQLLKLHCVVQLQRDATLPAFKGSMLHGWLGQQLKAQDSELYHLMFVPHSPQQPKPYAVFTHNHQLHWRAGDLFTFQITLYGSACSIGARLIQALTQQPLGLAGTPIRWQSIASQHPFTLQAGVVPTPLAHWLTPMPVNIEHQVALHWLSPLRIKHRGKLMQQQMPNLTQMLRQVQRRLMLLTKFWVNDDHTLEQHLSQRLPLGEYTTEGSQFYYEMWQRFSQHQQKLLPFGGLMGQFCYTGDIAAALPWLQLGEQLQVGGKTTFGLGAYQLII